MLNVKKKNVDADRPDVDPVSYNVFVNNRG